MLKQCKTKECKAKIQIPKQYCAICAKERVTKSRQESQKRIPYKVKCSENTKKPKNESNHRLDQEEFFKKRWDLNY